MNIQYVDGGVCAPEGFKAGGAASGIKNNGMPDLAMVVCEKKCTAAGVYTQNKVKAAPVVYTKNNLKDGFAQAILCNSGNANACNQNGMEAVKACLEMAEKATGIGAGDFVVASTGVIGQALPLEPFEKGIPQIVSKLSESGGSDAARAIMTTDTVRKEFAVEFEIGGRVCRIGAMAKGSGMININMATMLMFITTDTAISSDMMQKALKRAVEVTLNQVCVDGDTSTNDMAVMLASGLAGNSFIDCENGDYLVFYAALELICMDVAKALAADGEGATKLIECAVSGAKDDASARVIAKTVISSDLLKAAMFGEDANWGRVLCAIGYAPGDFPVDHISVTLRSNAGSVLVCRDSSHNEYSEEKAAEVLAEDSIEILVDMGCGNGKGRAWGCDLTYDYVKINGDYRS